MKIIDMKLLTLSMLLLFIGVSARPDSEVDSPSESPGGPVTEVSEAEVSRPSYPPPKKGPPGGSRKKRSGSSGGGLAGILGGSLEQDLQSILTVVESLPAVIENLTNSLESNPVETIISTLENLKSNPLSKALMSLPIIGNIVSLVETILQIPAGLIARILNLVLEIVDTVLGGLLGISSSSSTESSVTTASS